MDTFKQSITLLFFAATASCSFVFPADAPSAIEDAAVNPDAGRVDAGMDGVLDAGESCTGSCIPKIIGTTVPVASCPAPGAFPGASLQYYTNLSTNPARCYMFVNAPAMHARAAQDQCRKLGGHLASIVDVGELVSIGDFAANNSILESYTIGLIRNDFGNFGPDMTTEFTTGEEMDYSEFSGSYPMPFAATEPAAGKDCVIFNAATSEFETIECEILSEFLCEFNLVDY